MEEKKPYNRGDKYESDIYDIMQKKGVLKPGFERAGAAGNKADLIFVHKGMEYNLEAKKDHGADFGQKYLKWKPKEKKFVWSVDDSTTKLYTEVGVLDFINSVENSRRFHLNKISKSKEKITRIDNKEDQNFFDMNFKIPQDKDLLARFYNVKDIYYIQIGKHKAKTTVIKNGEKKEVERKIPCGFYHLGSDPADLGTVKFDGYMLIRFRAKQIRSELKEKFNFKNSYMSPQLKKVVLNMGLGIDGNDNKIVKSCEEDLGKITGQKPVITKFKKSISNFKTRKGTKAGLKVTLRKDKMYEFIDRLVNIALPRIKDFRGLSTKGFDKFGNYTFGIKEHIIFPEVNFDKVEKIRGLDITIVISSLNKDHSLELLKKLNFPFKTKGAN